MAGTNVGGARGTEARDALAEVLKDQAERAERRGKGAPRRRDRTPLLWTAAAALTVAAAWFWLAPPAFLLPPPPPAPPPELASAELRLTLFQAVLRIEQYRDSAGHVPESLERAFEGPEDVEGLEYTRLTNERFRITAVRDEQVAFFETGDSLGRLVAGTTAVLERVRP